MVTTVTWNPVKNIILITFHKLGEIRKKSKHVFPAKF